MNKYLKKKIKSQISHLGGEKKCNDDYIKVKPEKKEIYHKVFQSCVDDVTQ